MPSLSKVDLLDGYDLLCHSCFTFIALLLIGVVMQGWLRIMHSTGAPIDAHSLECNLLYKKHERLEKFLYTCVVSF